MCLALALITCQTQTTDSKLKRTNKFRPTAIQWIKSAPHWNGCLSAYYRSCHGLLRWKTNDCNNDDDNDDEILFILKSLLSLEEERESRLVDCSLYVVIDYLRVPISQLIVDSTPNLDDRHDTIRKRVTYKCWREAYIARYDCARLYRLIIKTKTGFSFSSL